MKLDKELSKNQMYLDAFSNYQKQSQILSGVRAVGWATVLWDQDNIKDELIKLEGDKDGHCFDQNSDCKWKLAEIPFTKSKINLIDTKFRDLNDRRIRAGQSPFENMTRELLAEKCLFSAKLTVLNTEADVLHKKLKEFKDQAEIKEQSKVLEHGPLGQAQIKNQ
jgi:hypothetical protein